MKFPGSRNFNVKTNYTTLDLTLDDRQGTENSNKRHRTCGTCSFSNEETHQFCARCGAPLQTLRQHPDGNPRAVELPSAIVVALIALFLGTLALVATLVIGGPIAATGAKVVADISKTPVPLPDASPNSNSRFDSSPSLSSPPEVTSTPMVTAIPTIPPPPNFSVSDLTTFDYEPKAESPDISTATVITENANLRTSPNISSDVVTTVPQGAAVHIIRQTGPWFYVRWESQRGWLHGNTIEFDLDE